MKKLKALLTERFGEVLLPLGFSHYEGPWVTFMKEVDGKRLYVAATHASYLKGFDVSLQEVEPNGKRRSTTLEEFLGVETFSYAGRDAQNAVDEATSALITYGMPWMRGDVVVTPAVRLRLEIANQGSFEAMKARGRDAFQRGQFREAIDHLERAATLFDLDVVSRKYLELARKRLS